MVSCRSCCYWSWDKEQRLVMLLKGLLDNQKLKVHPWCIMVSFAFMQSFKIYVMESLTVFGLVVAGELEGGRVLREHILRGVHFEAGFQQADPGD